MNAAWVAEEIVLRRHGAKPTPGGGTPWVAELTGFSARFELRREFLPARRDYTRANSRGTRGVRFHWVLTSGVLYEAYWPESYRTAHRAYLRVEAGADGHPVVVRVEEDEVLAELEERCDVAHLDRMEL